MELSPFALVGSNKTPIDAELNIEFVLRILHWSRSAEWPALAFGLPAPIDG